MPITRASLLAAALAIACAVAPGCIFDLGTIGHADFNRYEGPVPATPREFEGKDRVHVILGIPIGIPQLDSAMKEALRKGKGDVLVDARVSVGYWSVILYGQWTIYVEGKVVDSKEPPPITATVKVTPLGPAKPSTPAATPKPPPPAPEAPPRKK